mmetsp:Transcript_36236/g.84745  ORF Transcript_36236/g.84745 Transcript_36236/m.84745 type:complete len:143 (-) Transcript_36236:555-983(-)
MDRCSDRTKAFGRVRVLFDGVSSCRNHYHVAILFPIEKSFPQRLEDGSICAEQQRGADRGRLNFLSKLTEEMIEHQNALNLAHAIDIRNKSQLESFVDEAHQWEEMDDVDRSLLENLRSGVYEGRIDALKEAQRLVQSWRSF